MNNEEYKKFYIEATKVLDVIEDSVVIYVMKKNSQARKSGT